MVIYTFACEEQVAHFRDTDISEPLPQLIVFIHDFEQVDGIVLQDLFYICRYVIFDS